MVIDIINDFALKAHIIDTIGDRVVGGEGRVVREEGFGVFQIDLYIEYTIDG
jgi:hypothetical protein